MGQDLQYLYRVAGQFMGSEDVRTNLTRLTRYANRQFGPRQFAEKYYLSVNPKVRTWKPDTLGRIVALGLPETPKEQPPVKALPPTKVPVGQVPRTPFLIMVPDRDEGFFFSDKSGFGYLAQLATQVILAAMLDLSEREAANQDAQKGVHVLDLAEREIMSWTEGEMSLEDVELIIRTMDVRGQSKDACEAAWAAVLLRLASRKPPTSRDDWKSLIGSVSHGLWKKDY